MQLWLVLSQPRMHSVAQAASVYFAVLVPARITVQRSECLLHSQEQCLMAEACTFQLHLC